MRMHVLSAIIGCAITAMGGACMPPPPPIKYVAVTMPESVPAIAAKPGTYHKTRVGLMYRPPLDTGALLLEAGQVILKNVELAYHTPYCILLVCIGKDTLTAEGTSNRSDSKD